MTILDLIKKSALMLNVEQILNDRDLENPTLDDLSEIFKSNNTLVRMYEFAKLTINEVCSHSARINEIKCDCYDNFIPLRSIPNVFKVIAVKNDNGYVKFSIINNAIKLKENGLYTVIYYQNPEINSILDEVDNNQGRISDDVFLFGLNAYYSLANGLYAEYNVYNAQYIERLSQIKNLKVFSMPCRSWNE